MRLPYGILFLSLSFFFHVHAQPDNLRRPSPWSAGLLSMWDSQPYRGSTGIFRAFPFVSYRGDRLEWRGPFVSYTLVDPDKGPVVGIHAMLQFPAYEEEDADILSGLGDREYTLLTGFSISYPVHSAVRFSTRVDYESLGVYRGVQVSTGLAYKLGSPRSAFPLFGSVEGGLVYQSDNWTSYMVGVPEADARPGRPGYSPDASFHPYVQLMAVYQLNPKWSTTLVSKVDLLDAEWNDSPLIEYAYRVSTFLSLQYSF